MFLFHHHRHCCSCENTCPSALTASTLPTLPQQIYTHVITVTVANLHPIIHSRDVQPQCCSAQAAPPQWEYESAPHIGGRCREWQCMFAGPHLKGEQFCTRPSKWLLLSGLLQVCFIVPTTTHCPSSNELMASTTPGMHPHQRFARLCSNPASLHRRTQFDQQDAHNLSILHRYHQHVFVACKDVGNQLAFRLWTQRSCDEHVVSVCSLIQPPKLQSQNIHFLRWVIHNYRIKDTECTKNIKQMGDSSFMPNLQQSQLLNPSLNPSTHIPLTTWPLPLHQRKRRHYPLSVQLCQVINMVIICTHEIKGKVF